jgi:hypothetical protein
MSCRLGHRIADGLCHHSHFTFLGRGELGFDRGDNRRIRLSTAAALTLGRSKRDRLRIDMATVSGICTARTVATW